MPELIGGGFEAQDAGVESPGNSMRPEQDARATAAVSHRLQLEVLAARQKRTVVIEEELVSQFRAKLCGGQDKRALLAELRFLRAPVSALQEALGTEPDHVRAPCPGH